MKDSLINKNKIQDILTRKTKTNYYKLFMHHEIFVNV